MVHHSQAVIERDSYSLGCLPACQQALRANERARLSSPVLAIGRRPISRLAERSLLSEGNAPQLPAHFRTNVPKQTQRFAPACHFLSPPVRRRSLNRLFENHLSRRMACCLSINGRFVPEAAGPTRTRPQVFLLRRATHASSPVGPSVVKTVADPSSIGSVNAALNDVEALLGCWRWAVRA
jgi:hypothetical protein